MRHVAADHHPRQRRRRFRARIAFAGHPAAAQHGGAVAQLADLVELVADVEDAAAFGGERSQRGEEIRHRLRRQHGRRLVHDQQCRRLQQRADDLDALSLGHRQRVHRAFRVERKSVSLRYLAHARRQVRDGPRGVLRERDVFGDGQRLEQREMLEHHRDAEASRPRRIRDDDGLAVPADGPRVGTHDAVDDLHQRRFPRAVLAQHGVNLAWRDGEVDRIVGDDRGIGLGDAGEGEACGPAGVDHPVIMPGGPHRASRRRVWIELTKAQAIESADASCRSRKRNGARGPRLPSSSRARITSCRRPSRRRRAAWRRPCCSRCRAPGRRAEARSCRNRRCSSRC